MIPAAVIVLVEKFAVPTRKTVVVEAIDILTVGLRTVLVLPIVGNVTFSCEVWPVKVL